MIHLKSKTETVTRKLQNKFVHYHKTHFWFTIVAKNGKVLATSETYPSRRNALAGIKSFFVTMGLKPWAEKVKDFTKDKDGELISII